MGIWNRVEQFSDRRRRLQDEEPWIELSLEGNYYQTFDREHTSTVSRRGSLRIHNPLKCPIVVGPKFFVEKPSHHVAMRETDVAEDRRGQGWLVVPQVIRDINIVFHERGRKELERGTEFAVSCHAHKVDGRDTFIRLKAQNKVGPGRLLGQFKDSE